MIKIEKFMLHNKHGQSVFKTELKNWKDSVNPSNDVFGPTNRYTWDVNGSSQSLEDPTNIFWPCVLPDASGFICFEFNHNLDNCTLGRLRQRTHAPYCALGIDRVRDSRGYRNVVQDC